MKYKATVSFAGVISMRKGQEAELSNRAALSSLIKCGYITPIEAAEQAKQTAETLEEAVEVKTDGAKRRNNRRRKVSDEG